MNDTVKIVIGSWGSYAECNERALGSKWLDLSDYYDWDDIVEELKNEGFELNGIDEELFVQDIEGIESSGTNWDFTHPKEVFDTLLEAEVLTDSNKYEIMQAVIEVRGFNDFCSLVENYGSRWDEDINLYKGYTWEDYGKEMFDACCYQIEESLIDFFDFERYGEYIGSDCADVYSDGIIEIRNY